MKKIAVFLSVLSLLSASGCGNTENAQTDTTAEAPIYTVVIDEQTETTEAPTEQPTEATTAASSAETEAIAETTAESAVETTVSAAESTVSSEPSVSEMIAETIPDVQDTANLVGTWEYVNGYRFRFMEGNAAEMQVDYSSTMFFSGERLYYDGGQYTPLVNEEKITVTLDDGTKMLSLTALEREDGSNFNGRYRLEDCKFYQFLTDGMTERPAYEIEVRDSAFRVVMDAQYHATEDGVLELVQNDSTLKLHYIVEENAMTIFDENGAQDILRRVE